MDLIRYNSLIRFADHVCELPKHYYNQMGIDDIHGKEHINSFHNIVPYSKIFIKTDLIQGMLDQLLNITVPFHLLTGNADITIPVHIVDHIQKNKNMITWTGNNLIKFDERFLQVPIGFDELGPGRPNSYFKFPEPYKQKSIPIVLTPIGKTIETRNNVVNISGHNILNIQSRLNYSDYINLLNLSKYSICPDGNGVDTHRLMESIKMKSKPIVISSILNSMYEEMGCEIINSWDDLHRIDLDVPVDVDQKFASFAYWENRIHKHHEIFKLKNGA